MTTISIALKDLLNRASLIQISFTLVSAVFTAEGSTIKVGDTVTTRTDDTGSASVSLSAGNYLVQVGSKKWTISVSGTGIANLIDLVAITVPTPIQKGLPSGGSVGQVLGKKSNTDYDAGWLTAVLTDNNFTNALKTAYDSAVSWISTNGTGVVNHVASISNPHNVTKTQIGLANIDNTSDLNKPVSSATQTALNTKQNKLPIFLLSDYCTTLNDTTDNTVGFNAVLQAMHTAQGGKLIIDGYCRVDGAITIPYSNSSRPKQYPLRITGTMQAWSGWFPNILADFFQTKSVLDLRYAGSAQKSKIRSLGEGVIEIDHLTIKSGGTDDKLIFFTTNTTPFIHNNNWIGNQAKSERNCLQNAWQLGGNGTSIPAQTSSEEVMFQGYGGLIEKNHYSNFNTIGTFGNEVNSFDVRDETVSHSCGGGVGSAIYSFLPEASLLANSNASGNSIIRGTYEVKNYNHFAVLNNAPRNIFLHNGFYDFVGNLVSLFVFNEKSVGNKVEFSYQEEFTESQLISGINALNNDIRSTGISGFNRFYQPIVWAANKLKITTDGYIQSTNGVNFMTVDTAETAAYMRFRKNGANRGFVGFANNGVLTSNTPDDAMIIRGELALVLAVGALAAITLDSSGIVNMSKIKLTGLSPAMEVDSVATNNWIRFKQNGTTRGYVGYAQNGDMFAGGQDNAMVLRAETAIDIGIGATPIMSIDSAGKTTIKGDLASTATGFLQLPQGTTAQRPGTPLSSMVRYNTTTTRHEFYTAAGWQNHARLAGDTFTGNVSIDVGTIGNTNMFTISGGNVSGMRINSTGASNTLEFYNAGVRNYAFRTNYNFNGFEIDRSTIGGGAAIIPVFCADALGNVVIGRNAVNATTATDEFLYIPTVAGTPTGLPTAQFGKVAMEFDTTNNKIWIYNGSWKSVTLA